MQRLPLDVMSSLCSVTRCCSEGSSMDKSSGEACCSSRCSKCEACRCMLSGTLGRGSGSCISCRVHEKNRLESFSRSCSRTLPCSPNMSRCSISGRRRRRLTAWALPLAVAVVVLAWLGVPVGAAVTDQFVPMCSDYSDPPPSGWQLWSNSTTWPAGVVPGVGGSMGVDVVIPCDTGVILDTNVTVGLLDIRGSLKVVHAGPFQVFANNILNQGRLTIGTPTAPYTGKIIFNLTGSATELTIPRDPTNPSIAVNSRISLGTRGFITLGGQLSLNGMYANNPGWTTLAATAQAGATALRLKGDVGAWPVGGQIAIASTDFDRYQAEYRTITSVQRLMRAGAPTVTVVGLSAPLQWMHWGDPLATGVAGVSMDEAAEVVLLSRAIVVQGHPNPVDPLIGGHFIVVQTPWPQSIIGVELANMGQQGNLGRYPMHFHLCQDVTGSLVKSCVVHRSNQRCYVVHGTWNLRLEGNAAVNTKGHCYMLEDGIEFGNQFINNVGFLQEPPLRTLQPTDPIPATQSDKDTATFWITNPNNTWIGNVAAGSSDSGFWFEAPQQVQGPSAYFPQARGMSPFLTPLFVFENNAAHSNGRAGLRTYPSGYLPRLNGGVSMRQDKSGVNAPQVNVTVRGFRAYKNQFIGIFVHNTDGLQIDGAMVADNGNVGIELHGTFNCMVSNSIILGETDNIGTPSMCNIPGDLFGGCMPLRSTGQCSLPIDPSLARSNSRSRSRYAPVYGILIDQHDPPQHGWGWGVPHRVVNTTFAKFYDLCRPAAGITANGHSQYMWPATHSSRNLSFPDGSPGLYLVPRNRGQLGFDGGYGDAGVYSTMYVWRDEDGTLLAQRAGSDGSAASAAARARARTRAHARSTSSSSGSGSGAVGGFAVANNSALLPPDASRCTPVPEWNGYACPGTCYRSVSISGGSFRITRAADGVEVMSSGVQFVNLLANNAYVLTPIGAAPQSLSVMYVDGGFGCSDPILLQLVPPTPSTLWQFQPSSGVFWQPCVGSTLAFQSLSLAQWVCGDAGQQGPLLQITMGGAATAPVRLSQVASTAGGNDGFTSCSTRQCGVVLPGSPAWLYSTDPQRGYPSDFLSLRPRLQQQWGSGVAPLGYGGQGENTTLPRATTTSLAWYMRKEFNLTHGGCYSWLVFSYISNDGVVVFLNGGELFRTNMPSTGPIVPTTRALEDRYPTAPWTTTMVDAASANLRSGRNVVMVELHAASPNSWEVQFDMALSAIGARCPPAIMFEPRSVVRTPPAAGTAK